ncbi:MAG: hypothetical protein UR34_C0009G0012 [candidate division WS6 bacterium GW2011_GWC1_33_20]|uniref:PPM-type phosphatase domain-containing protein n=1 Tax=candidate division WS6 bacterium GW2011_GWC1_33_20 TaxID=1619089 RepID=A0A0F9ZY37_9BACT|nr:MAG: hypothetical protein UR34_C0009G0012 [candidate division WS6 bacterium GW2011_GWC1_33_20]OGC35830.1 MAG: hypothetical protein A2369_01940 [candidate division WS6 bacterium RIFOXYB1_FULL_33_15]
MSITATKYLKNSNLANSFTGLFHYARPTRGKNDVGVEIYGLLSVSSKTEIPGDKISKFAWDGIIDGFEYSKLDSINESLKLSLTEATRRVKQLISNDSNIAQHGVDINFSIFVSSNGDMYIGLLGEGDIFVYKNGRIVDIFEMLSSKKAKTAGLIVDNGDIVFTSTKGLLKEDMKRIISTKTRDELISALEDIGREVGDNQGLVVFYKNHQPKDVVVQKVAEVVKEDEKEVINPEPKDSDYIPISKPRRNIFKPRNDEKDLKSFLTTLFSKIKIPTKIFDKVSLFLKNSSKKVSSSIGKVGVNTFNKVKSGISEKFGRKKWFKKVSAKVSQSNIGQRKERGFKEFKIDGYKDRNKRFYRFKIFFFVLLGIVLVVGGVKFTLDQKEARAISKSAQEIFVNVEASLKSAEEKLRTDKESSAILVLKASNDLAKVPEGLSEKDQAILDELNGKILGIEDSIYKKVRVSKSDKTAEEYISTRLSVQSGEGSKPSDIAIYNDGSNNEFLIVTDPGLKSVYRISLYDKESKIIPTDTDVILEPSFVYVKTSGVYVLDKKSGVVKAEFDGNWFKPFTKLSGLSMQSLGAKDIAEFAVLTENENIYILDREKESLLKSSNFGSGYGLSSPYVTNEDFAQANDIFADLSTYILAKGENGIHRYINSPTLFKLVPSDVTILGLDTPLKNPRYGYTRDDLNYSIYVFDSEDKRILRFEKSIEGGDIRHPNQLLLLNQYIYDGAGEDIWSNVKDLVVDREEEYLYMLDGTTIWKIRL